MAQPTGVREVRRGRSVRIWLSGELDLRCLEGLRAALRTALRSRRPVLVDLSGVTFLEELCLRELAVHYQLNPGRLVLWRPSAEVRLTRMICGLEDWVRFYPDEAASRPPGTPDATVAAGGPGATLRQGPPPSGWREA